MSLSEEVRVTCDPDAMVQVVTNLLGNAVKFSPEGSEVEVDVMLSDPDTLRVEVRDDGPGVDPADRQRIFEPFWQGDSSDTRRTGGTGLGLTVSSAIVELHGGKIGLDSESGEGSTFWVEVPLAGPGRDG
jgi:two-component system phosphate regulon sensor histidine kinase PhoR